MSASSQIRTGTTLIWVTATLLVASILYFRLFEPIENETWDMRQRLIAQPNDRDPKIKIIMIDQTSIDLYARREKIYWPWPRSLYNPVLRYLKRAGARGVAFDMLFTESSHHVGDDDEFAQEVRGSLPIVSAVSLLPGEIDVDPAVMKLFKTVQGARSESIKPYLADRSVPVYAGASYPIPQLIESSAALGNVTADSDSDKIFRRTVPGAYLNDVPVLGLPFALYDVTHPDSSLIPQLDRIADSGGRLHIRFHGPSATYDTVSIAAVINSWLKLEEGKDPDIPLSEFKDAYVFVGTNAPGLFDLRPAPLAGNYPGVELNATILDNILHRSFLRTVPTHLALGIAAVFLGFVAVLATKVERFQIPMIVAVLSVWVGISIFVAHKGWWLPLVAPTVGSLYVLLLVFLLKYRIEGREHRFIRNAFQHYVTPEVIDQIVRDPSHLSLGGERRELTILFSDIRGFTSISEKMKPAQLVGFLNKFLSEMTDIILAAGGTIDKYEGDAIIAFWNAPVKVVDHEKRGVQAALACQMRLRELRSTFAKEYGIEVGMRVGLHSGLVTVGNFGSTTRFNYTVIGDAANLASRLEGANKVFGTETLVSADTRKKAGEEYIWRQVAKIRVVGRHEPVVVFEPLQPGIHDQTIALLGEYERARGLFEEGALAEAESRFATLKNDPVSNAYRERIELFRKGGLEFSSVWNLTEK